VILERTRLLSSCSW